MKCGTPPCLGPTPRSLDHIASGKRFTKEKKGDAFSALTISLGKLTVNSDKDKKKEISVARVCKEIDDSVSTVVKKEIEDVKKEKDEKGEENVEERDKEDDEQDEEGELCHRSPERPSHGGHRLEPYMNQNKLLLSGGIGRRVREEIEPIKPNESLNISKEDLIEDILNLGLIESTNVVMGMVSDYMGDTELDDILQKFDEDSKIPTPVLELTEQASYDNLPSVSSGYGSPRSVRTASPSNSYLGSQTFYHGNSDNTSSGYHSSPGHSPPFSGYPTDSQSPSGYHSPSGDVFSPYSDAHAQENQFFQYFPAVDSNLEMLASYHSDYSGSFPQSSPLLPQFVPETNLPNNTLLLNDDINLAQLVPIFDAGNHTLETPLSTTAISVNNINLHSPHSSLGTSPPNTYFTPNGSVQVSSPIASYIPQPQVQNRVNVQPQQVGQRLEAISYFEEQSAKTRLVQKLNEANKSMIWANISTKKDVEITQADADGDTQLMILLLIESNKCPHKLEFIYSLIERLKDIKGGLQAVNKQNHSVLYLAAIFYPDNERALVTRYIAETMIEQDVNMNELIVNNENETLLECLCKEGEKHYEVLVELLSLRDKTGLPAFDINKYNHKGMTPLHLAVTNHGFNDVRSIKTVLLLVNLDADTLKMVQGQEENSFHLAINSSCEPKLVEALLKDKRAVMYLAKTQYYGEDTLLHCVARRNDVALEKQKKVYELLVANGVRSFQGKQGQYPIKLVSPSRKEEFRKFCKK